MNRLMAMTMFVALSFVGVCLAQDKATEEQFQGVAASRAKADAALRKLRAYYEQAAAPFTQAQAAPDVSYKRIGENIAKAILEEQRKPEAARKPAVIEELNQRRGLIEQDWARYLSSERPAIENAFRVPQQQVATLGTLWSNLVNNEASWKLLRLDPPALQAMYDAVATRADELRAAGEKAVANAEIWKKIWATAAESTTRPVFPK